MADFKSQLDEWNRQLNEFVEKTKVYFSQLNDYEKYAWVGESVGFVVFIVGIVLFFV